MSANIPYTSVDTVQGYHLRDSESLIGSVLSVIKCSFPDIHLIISRARMEHVFDSIFPATIFIPENYRYTNMSIREAVTFCRSMTVSRYIDDIALRSFGNFTLKTLATPFDIEVDSREGSIMINNRRILNTISCSNGVIHILES